MANALQQAGAIAEPSNFAPLHTNRLFTGLWTNRNVLRDAATNEYQERYGMGRQDSILDGYNAEISTRLTLARRPGSSVYNSNSIAPVNRFYSFNTFTLTDEAIRVLADTDSDVLDITDNGNLLIHHKAAGAGSTYFLSVGNVLYMTNGVENLQWNYATGDVSKWGIDAPVNPPSVTQSPRSNTYPAWQAETAYEVNSPALSGIVIVDDLSSVPSNCKFIPTVSGGRVAILCGQNYANGTTIALPPGFDASRMFVWTSPGVGYNASALPAGVYQSNGTGGVLNSSFQNRSGGYDFDATSNWIAVAWDATATGDITRTTVGAYTQLKFRTLLNDDLCFQFGSGANGSSVPVPSGFASAQSLHIAGMIGCNNVDHSLQGVSACRVDVGTLATNNYEDGSGNNWTGTQGIFSVYWKTGQGTSTATVDYGTALLIPVSGTDTTALIFCVVPEPQVFGLPPGYSASQIAATCAMNGAASGGDNRGHGWSCLLSGQRFVGYYMDSEGNQWQATANVFAVGSTATAGGGNVQFANGTGTTGTVEPTWNPATGGITTDNTINWKNLGPAAWQPNHTYAVGSVVMGVVVNPPGTPNQMFVVVTPGTSAATEPHWTAGVNLQTQDGGIVWQCIGRALSWSDLGPSTTLTAASTILDPNGYLQTIYSPGVSGSTLPTFSDQLGGLTNDGTVVWQNIGAFAVADTAARQYGYAYMNSETGDISNMSPPSPPITIMQGNHAIVQGEGSADPQVDTIVIYRTAQGGSTFLEIATIPNPGAGQTWTYIDDGTDDDLNTEWQAQVAGEGTPLPAGATCMAWHLDRIFAAVGNVVWISSGPDAAAAASSGNAGFDTFLTAQSKITRFWTCPLGLIVFTVRDAYIILGSATDADPLYMVVFIEDLPLRSYDCFAVNKTTPFLLLGNNTLISLDPSAGISEVGFPIADRLEEEFDSSASYVTFHKEASADTALYVADGIDHWYRMAATNAPESGSSWSPRAMFSDGIGCVQSVEVAPGIYRLLMSGTSPGPILNRDRMTHADNGTPYPADTVFGSIVLAQPGQLAALHFITLESVKVGTRASLALLLGEISGTFEVLQRTRQDPTNLPPSDTLYSDRYHFKQNQQTAWCRHFQMEIAWPPEDAANELLTFTIFGETWNEMRAQ